MARQRIQQPHEPAVGVEYLNEPLERAAQEIARIEGTPQVAANVVNELQFPDEASIGEIHPPAFDRARDGGEKLIRLARLLDERERIQLVRRNGRRDRRRARDDDDLCVRLTLLDAPNGIEPRLRTKR